MQAMRAAAIAAIAFIALSHPASAESSFEFFNGSSLPVYGVFLGSPPQTDIHSGAGYEDQDDLLNDEWVEPQSWGIITVPDAQVCTSDMSVRTDEGYFSFYTSFCGEDGSGMEIDDQLLGIDEDSTSTVFHNGTSFEILKLYVGDFTYYFDRVKQSQNVLSDSVMPGFLISTVRLPDECNQNAIVVIQTPSGPERWIVQDIDICVDRITLTDMDIETDE